MKLAILHWGCTFHGIIMLPVLGILAVCHQDEGKDKAIWYHGTLIMTRHVIRPVYCIVFFILMD